ncbi:TPA: LysR family transcriptional regulator [Streptococcus suis]|nr:LysR family transcriptional regulator [Streptococcus suis]
MNLQHLEFFIALAESEHMTQTAKKLNTSQPNLSYMISELERELGAPLFKKSGRNIKLTKYGRIYYEAACQSFKSLEQASQLIKADINPNQGKIALGFIYAFGASRAPKLIQTFQSHYPNVQFHLEQNNSKRLLERLEREDLDLAIVSKVEGFQQLDFQPLTTEKLVIIVPENHKLAHQEQVCLVDTMNDPYVYFNHNSGLRPFLDLVFDQLGIYPKTVLELEDDQSIFGFVAEGFGIAIVPDIPSISSFPVKKLAIQDQIADRYLYLAKRKEDFQSPIQEIFTDFCINFFDKKSSLISD